MFNQGPLINQLLYWNKKIGLLDCTFKGILRSNFFAITYYAPQWFPNKLSLRHNCFGVHSAYVKAAAAGTGTEYVQKPL